MIHAPRRRHCGCKFRYRSGNEPVEEGHGDEFVENAWCTSIVDCYCDGAAECYPSVSGCDGNAADAEEVEVAVEFLVVAGGVDGEVCYGAGEDFWVLL